MKLISGETITNLAQLEADQKDVRLKIAELRNRLDNVDNYYVGLQEADRTRLMYRHTIRILEELLSDSTIKEELPE